MAVVMGKPALPGLLQLTLIVFSFTILTRDTMVLATFSPPNISSFTGDSQLYKSDIRGLELSEQDIQYIEGVVSMTTILGGRGHLHAGLNNTHEEGHNGFLKRLCKS